MLIDTIRAMIIEGDDNFRQTFLGLLSRRFPSVRFREQGGGDTTLKDIEVFLPHIVFMDLKLPRMSGLELTKRIKQLYPGLIIVIVTGLDLPEYKDAAHERGADYFISKNTSSAQDVLHIVKNIIKGLESSALSPE